MSAQLDANLYARGTATLIASWEEYAKGAADAFVQGGWPASLPPSSRTSPSAASTTTRFSSSTYQRKSGRDAVNAMEAASANAGVDRFAAWVHERRPGDATPTSSDARTR